MTADPYRMPVHAAPRRAARRLDTTPASAVPLGLIAICLFLPVAHDCNRRIEAPIDVAAQSVWSFLSIAPMFIAAAALSIAIAYTYKTRSSSTWTPLAFVAVHALSASVVGLVALVEEKTSPFMLAVLPALPLFTVAWWRRGVARLSLLVDAYVFASLPLALLIAMVAELYGAYVFLFAYALLVLLRVTQWIARVVWWSRDRLVLLR